MNQRMRGGIAAVIGLLLVSGCTGDDDGAAAAPDVSTVTTTPSTAVDNATAQPPASTVVTQPTAAPTVSATETLARVTLQEREYGGVNFESPTGNIHCSMRTAQDDAVSCLVREATWSIPDPGDCGETDWAANELSVFGGVVFDGVCRGDSFEIADPPVLEYGQEVISGDARCVSRENGVTCENLLNGAGFRLSREDYEVF